MFFSALPPALPRSTVVPAVHSLKRAPREKKKEWRKGVGLWRIRICIFVENSIPYIQHGYQWGTNAALEEQCRRQRATDRWEQGGWLAPPNGSVIYLTNPNSHTDISSPENTGFLMTLALVCQYNLPTTSALFCLGVTSSGRRGLQLPAYFYARAISMEPPNALFRN